MAVSAGELEDPKKLGDLERALDDEVGREAKLARSFIGGDGDPDDVLEVGLCERRKGVQIG